MRKKIISVFSYIILIITAIVIAGTKYIEINYGDFVKELFFYIQSGLEATGGNAIETGIKESIIPFVILMFYLLIPIIGLSKCSIGINMKIFKYNLKLCFPIKNKLRYSIIVFLLSLVYMFISFDIKDILIDLNTESYLYEEYYVNPKEVEFNFPKKKRNLIILFAESMESTLITKENGGQWTYSVIPELEDIALDNINFSNNSKVGGAISAAGTTWTVSGMVAQTSGINMSFFQQNSNHNSYTKDSFLSGAYTLGDVLKENGYNQELLMGSDAAYGGRKQYFTYHGEYEVFDYVYASEKKLVKDYIWWGFEDYKMFDFAKEELNKLSSKEEPFSLIMLTADTHFDDGCIDCIREENKVTKYSTQYENVYASSSKEIYNFIKWLEKQDYYEDTTIVIIGDHLSMQYNYFRNKGIADEDRYVYNAFINSSVDTDFSKNRKFSSLDIYPTILASIGVEIPGNRLGLGTNLFSGEKTLFEELGVETVQRELGRRSDFYNKNILGSDYEEIILNDLK